MGWKLKDVLWTLVIGGGSMAVLVGLLFLSIWRVNQGYERQYQAYAKNFGQTQKTPAGVMLNIPGNKTPVFYGEVSKDEVRGMVTLVSTPGCNEQNIIIHRQQLPYHSPKRRTYYGDIELDPLGIPVTLHVLHATKEGIEYAITVRGRMGL